MHTKFDVLITYLTCLNRVMELPHRFRNLHVAYSPILCSLLIHCIYLSLIDRWIKDKEIPCRPYDKALLKIMTMGRKKTQSRGI